MDNPQATSDSAATPAPLFDTGCEYVVDAYGCEPEALRDLATIHAVCEQAVSSLNLNVVGEPLWHQFPDPGGVTGLYLLSESHLACHTYPENGFASFNLYCCRPQSDWPWEDVLKLSLQATRVTVRCLQRGTQPSGGQE